MKEAGGIGRVRRSESEWRQLIAELERSGQSQAVFCRSRGVALGSLGNWRRRLRAAMPNGADFVELMPAIDKGPGPGWEVELELGTGMVLRLRGARC